MSWQNWVISRMVHNQIRKPTKREPFDPIATRLHAEKRRMPSPVELPPDWRITPADDVSDDGLTGEWIEPADPDLHDDTPIVLYLHGGGYFFCNPRTHRPITIGLATHARTRVCVPDYRLAPEHPFPASVKDVLFAYRALVTQGASPSRIVVAGDSAGGRLALALLVALHDAADPLPAGTVLYSPWTDLATTGQSLIDSDGSDVMFRGAWMAHGMALYLGGLDAPTDRPLASPLRASFTGLSTLHCYVSTSEVLRDDVPQTAKQARATRVSVPVGMGRRLPHVWPIFYPFLPETRIAPKRSGEQIRRLVTAQRENREPVELTPA